MTITATTLRPVQYRLTGLTPILLRLVDTPTTDKFKFAGGDGFGPPDVEILASERPWGGSMHNGSRPKGRELVIRIGLNPDYYANQTAAELRTELYGLLTTGPEGDVLVEALDKNDIVLVKTRGSVSKLEIVPFAKDPEVQVTISCPSPYWEAPTIKTLTPPPPNTTSFTIDNVGTAPAPLICVIKNENPTDTSFALTISQAFTFDDLYRAPSFTFSKPTLTSMYHIYLDSRPETRDALIHNNDQPVPTLVQSALPYMSTMSGKLWPTLHGGRNYLRSMKYYEPSLTEPAWSWRSISYYPMYWGI